jgi:hypothetical protein
MMGALSHDGWMMVDQHRSETSEGKKPADASKKPVPTETGDPGVTVKGSVVEVVVEGVYAAGRGILSAVFSR